MTVEELIRKLQACDGSSRVVIPGYEGGFKDVTVVKPIPVELNTSLEWYYGPHELATDRTDKRDIHISILIK